MSYHTRIIFPLMLLGILGGCGSNPPAPALSEAQLEAQRNYTAKLQQQDRNSDHTERMRRAEADKKAGGYYYSPYWRTSRELSNITVR